MATTREVQLSLVYRNGDAMVDLRQWRLSTDDQRAGPTRTGFRFTTDEARELHKHLTLILKDVVDEENHRRLTEGEVND